jgi:hypothetical protein
MEKMYIKTRELDHLKMTDQPDTATCGDDPTTTTTTALIAKQPQVTRTTVIQAMTTEIVGIPTTTYMTWQEQTVPAKKFNRVQSTTR